MEFYKKLVAGKSSSNESIDNTLSEIERKFVDMQPVIQNPTADKSKVQKTILDIKAHVESLKAMGGSVTVEQQERIKDITRKYNEISIKHSYISDVSGTTIPKSPRAFRKAPEVGKETAQIPQNKIVFRQEVEETLKVMRQKRLDRLSTFVAEQSKLSEERSNRNNDTNEFEDAIKSIQKTAIEKTTFKSIAEENIIQHKIVKEEVANVKSSPKLGRSRSNESDRFKTNKSSTLKLINRFNCTLPSDSSTEDLTQNIYTKSSSINKMELSQDTYFTKPNENWERPDSSHSIPDNLNDANILLSPKGKQRKAVYMYDHECQFLESEKRSSLPPLSTFGKDINQETTPKKNDVKPKIHTYENREIIVQNQTLPNKSTTKNEKENICLRTKKHVYENNEIVEYRSSVKSQELKSRDGNKERNSLGNVIDVKEKENEGIKIEKDAKIDNNENTKVNDFKKLPKLFIKTDINPRRKFNRHPDNLSTLPPQSPLKSPLPLPRRNNHAERILKKVQRNWESLDEILENDSDVDCDEIEDLKKTWQEATALLKDYKMRINKLDRRSREEENMEKLEEINTRLEEIEKEIDSFKGLKRDRTYKELSSRLSNYFLDVNKIHFSFNDGVGKKHNTLEKIGENIKRLESRVLKNENMLLEILDMQVRSIGTNCLYITKV